MSKQPRKPKQGEKLIQETGRPKEPQQPEPRKQDKEQKKD